METIERDALELSKTIRVAETLFTFYANKTTKMSQLVEVLRNRSYLNSIDSDNEMEQLIEKIAELTPNWISLIKLTDCAVVRIKVEIGIEFKEIRKMLQEQFKKQN